MIEATLEATPFTITLKKLVELEAVAVFIIDAFDGVPLIVEVRVFTLLVNALVEELTVSTPAILLNPLPRSEVKYPVPTPSVFVLNVLDVALVATSDDTNELVDVELVNVALVVRSEYVLEASDTAPVDVASDQYPDCPPAIPPP